MYEFIFHDNKKKKEEMGEMGDGGKGVIRIRTDSFDTEQCGHCVRMAHLKSITAIR